MKKILLSMLVAATFGLTATSCTKEEVILESSGTRVAEFTVHIDEWQKNEIDAYNPNSGNYYYYTVDWNVLNEHVVYDGNVSVYVYNNGRQNALPYTYPVEVMFDDGTTGIVGESLSYDFEPGHVTVIMQDLDGWMPQLTLENTTSMTFRIVATAPINYIINQ